MRRRIVNPQENVSIWGRLGCGSRNPNWDTNRRNQDNNHLALESVTEGYGGASGSRASRADERAGLTQAERINSVFKKRDGILLTHSK